MSETPRVVLMVIPSSAYDRGLLEGITSYAQIHGPWVFLLSGDHPDLPIPASDSLSGDLSEEEHRSSGKVAAATPSFERLNATGLIGRISNPLTAKRLLSAGLPAVASFALANADIERLLLRSKASEIVADAARTGQFAAEHFLDRGFWNYAFCGYEGRAWVERRLEGFAERRLVWKQEVPRVVAWLKSLPRPVAVMACNDKRGRQVIEACLLAGLKVPEEVAVVGVDNDHLFGNLSNPPLSSVALNLSKAGYQAAELLDQLMRGAVRKPRQIVIEPLWVVPRRSSDVIAVDDPHLAIALHFIREHAKETIGVDDVVEQAGISRRGLEIRFHNVLRRSIRGEIQRVRLAQVRQLLTETNLSVDRIAQLTSFCSVSHLGGVFRHEFGATPAQFRRRTRAF